jgi:hypothetical protein
MGNAHDLRVFRQPEKRGRIFSLFIALVLFVLGAIAPSSVWAQAALEDPQPGSRQSGIGLIRGWVCQANQVEIEIDGTRLPAAYGTARGDTRSVCGDDNNGFGLTANWNLLGDGIHRLRAFADGAVFADVTFGVLTLGGEFLRGLSGGCTVPNFPRAGESVNVAWQESNQNFIIAQGSGGGGGNAGDGRQSFLEGPQPGSRQSGMGLIRGWVCQASRVEVEIDGIRLPTAYGTARGDTHNACGDSNNGFGFAVNWNLLGDGVHRLRAFADDTQFADVSFSVSTLGGDFLRGLSGGCTIPNFPQAGSEVSVRWEESLQNFAVSCVSTGAADTLACQGLLALSAGDLRTATAAFNQALATDPTNARANVALATTRVAAKVLDDQQLVSLATRSGVVITGDSRNICGLRITLPQDIPATAPRTGEIVTTARSVLLPEIEAALGNLGRVAEANTVLVNPIDLPSCLRLPTRSSLVEIDRGDTTTLAGILRAAHAALDILAAYDADVDLQTAVKQPPRDILAAAPALLTLRSAASLTTARGFTDQALADLTLGITTILAEEDDQTNDVLVILPQDRVGAERTQQIFNLLRQSLQTQIVLPTDVGLPEPERVDLSLFFSGGFTTLRPFLPAFTDRGTFDEQRFPDPTFGGIAPDLTQQDLTKALQVLCPLLSGRSSCQSQGL